MIFEEYYGAPVFAGAQFEFDSGANGHTMHVYTDAVVCYILTVELLEVTFPDSVGYRATKMVYGGDTFKTKSIAIRGLV